MSITGGQSQEFNGIPQMLGRTKPRVWKMIDADANTIQQSHAASPDTLIVYRHYTGSPKYNSVIDPAALGTQYARDLRAAMGNGWFDGIIGEAENEPVVFSLADAQKLNLFTMAFIQECLAQRIIPCIFNFSEGHPEVFVLNSDYVIDPYLFNALVPSFRYVRDANGYYGRHEYSCPVMQSDYSDAHGLGYRTGRHKADLLALPVECRDVPILVTESGVDWVIVGQAGGFWHNGGTIMPFIEQLKWYESICAPNVRGNIVFGHQMFKPKWEEYDTARTLASAQLFEDFINGGASSIPPGGTVTATERYNAAWHSIGIVPNPDAALYKYALSHGLGKPEGNEYPYTSSDGKQYIGQGYNLAFVQCIVGDYGNIHAYDWLTGELYVPVAPPVVPPSATRLTTLLASYAPLHFIINLFAAQTGQQFFGLIAVTDPPVIDISARFVFQVSDLNGQPKPGAACYHLFGNSFECFKTDGFGLASFNLGSGSGYSATGGESPKDRFYIGEAYVDQNTGLPPRAPIGDVYFYGLPDGHHIDATYSVRLMVA